MSTEAFNIVFKNYPETVILSEKRTKKYIKKGKKLNKTQQKLLDKGTYIWKERGTGAAKGEYLFDAKCGNPDLILFTIDSGEFILKNPKAAGTPNIKPINGQTFWEAGSGNEWLRLAIKEQLRTWFVPQMMRHLPDQIYPPRDHFIQFEYIFFYPFDLTRIEQYQDYINHAYVRSKVFEDVLVEMEKIKDDNPGIVQGGYARYVNISTTEERRLEVKIHFCKNGQRIS